MEYVRIYVSLIQHFGVSDASKENVGLPTDFHPTCILCIEMCIDCSRHAPNDVVKCLYRDFVNSGSLVVFVHDLPRTALTLTLKLEMIGDELQ